MAIDYKLLLEKYLNHVGYEEGTSFTSFLGSEFSEEEAAELRRIDAESVEKNKAMWESFKRG